MPEPFHSAPSEELDLMIHDMETEPDELRVKSALTPLPAIQTVRLLQGGAFIRYNPLGITMEEIITAVRQAGFRASTFQDSKNGRTGLSAR